MCLEDLTVNRGRLSKRLAALAAVLVVAPGLAACGEEDQAAQSTAPAETGTAQTGSESESTSDGPDAADAGGADEPAATTADPEAAITQTLEVLLAKSDSVACGELFTDRFVRRSYGDQNGCEAALDEAAPAKDAGVTYVTVSDESVAQALARPEGGIYDHQKLRAELVLEDEAWKLDSLRSNVPVGP